MGSSATDKQEEAPETQRRWLPRAALALGALALAVLAYVWLTREQIAGDFIDDYLNETGLEASYDIVSIGPQRQVVENIVIGDPQAPDLTIDRVSVDVTYGLGTPGVGSVMVDRPRLYGSLREGNLSFGALDSILFAESDSDAGLPAMDITIREGGALLETDYGRIGASFEGTGPLDDGFSGKLALTAPGMGVEACSAESATAYGDVSTVDGGVRFDGPLRLRALQCEGAQLASADIGAVITTHADFSKIEGGFDIATGALRYADASAAGVNGRASMSLSEGLLVLDHDVALDSLQSPFAGIASLRADGALRSARGFSETSWNAQIEGEGLAMASLTSDALSGAREAGEGTLLGPLVAKLQKGLDAAMQDTRLLANATGRMEGEALSLVVPEASLRSGSGETVLAISRLSWSRVDAQSEARLAGNFLTGGANLPQISGRVDQAGNGPMAARLSVAPFVAGEDRIAVPSLSLRGTGGGGYAFSGLARASGAIPGGSVTQLEVPLNGRITSGGGVQLGGACENVRFQGLAAYDLALGPKSLRVCPGANGSMLSLAETLDIDVVSEALELEADLAGSPVNLTAQAAGFRYPGGFELQDLSAVIGEPDNAVRLTSARLWGGFEENVGGQFEGATAALDVVPMDLSEMAGLWSYDGGVLRVSETDFTLTERTQEGFEARFNPLRSQGAVLTLDGSAITAVAGLDHKEFGIPLADVSIAHNLSSSEGRALIDVPGLNFGSPLSVQDLTELARGVIAYTQGTVTGEGRIDWNSDDVTSSGVFRTDDLDLAAAFGPVEGIKGEVRFSDLLNMTTQPGQVIEIGSINPGIEAIGGAIQFSLTDGTIIDIDDARWPFMGGELIMRPTKLEYGTEKDQRYTFEIVALDAATFVAQMELSNLGATGTFDGTVPIVFDANGNGRIENGLLISRNTGGNVSYIGELTYEDMGAISNYAFQSLRSLDFRQMSVALSGDLAGEIITRFQIDGVRQGDDASRNFVTRRLAKLPIRFDVNVRAENFYELATMARTFMDPDALPDAVDQGLIPTGSARSEPSEPSIAPDSPEKPTAKNSNADAIRPRSVSSADSPVQAPESETVP